VYSGVLTALLILFKAEMTTRSGKQWSVEETPESKGDSLPPEHET